MKHSAFNDSLTVLAIGNAPTLLNITHVTDLLTALCSVLSLGYTIYRFTKTPKDKENGRDSKKEE